MGDPHFQRKKYKAPRHPWMALRITEENELLKDYGLKNKKEIWKAEAILKKWRTQAKRVMTMPKEEQEKHQKILLGKLINLGILMQESDLDSVLTLTVRDILERRLQTIIRKLGLAHTVKQARQFIVHKKVTVNGVKVASPSTLVKQNDKVNFISGFNLQIVTPKQKELILEGQPKEMAQEVENA